MQVVFYLQARNNLRSIIDKVCDDFEEYSAMKETMYFLSSKNNTERLLDSVEEIDNLKFEKNN